MKRKASRRRQFIFIVSFSITILLSLYPTIREFALAAYGANDFEVFSYIGPEITGSMVVDMIIALIFYGSLEAAAISVLATVSISMFMKDKLGKAWLVASLASLLYLSYLLIKIGQKDLEEASNQVLHSICTSSPNHDRVS